MAIQTVLFDLGNVLVFFSHERMWRQIGEVCGAEAEAVERCFVQGGLLRKMETGTIPLEEVARHLESLGGRAVDPSKLLHATADIFWPNPPMEELLRELRGLGIRLVLLSNTCWPHIEHVRKHFSVLKHFDDLVLSCAVGAVKPERAIFEAAKKKIACEPAQCLYTDDILAFVEAGRRFGFQTHHFREPLPLRCALRELGVPVHGAC